jgi:hypothetical protein
LERLRFAYLRLVSPDGHKPYEESWAKGVIMRVLRITGVVTGLAAIFAFTMGPAFAAGSVTEVTKDGQGGWHKQVTSPDGSVTFVPGPDTPPIGDGSAHLTTGTHGDESAQLRNTGYKGKKLSDLSKLSYWTYVHQNNGQQFPYLILNIDTNNNGHTDQLLFFEPPYQSSGSGGVDCAHQHATAIDIWQGWDALSGCWYAINSSTGDPTYGGPGTASDSLAGYESQNPHAKIVNSDSGLGGVRLLVGFASPDDRFDANVDSFRIAFGDAGKVFDFDTP